MLAKGMLSKRVPEEARKAFYYGVVQQLVTLGMHTPSTHVRAVCKQHLRDRQQEAAWVQ